MLIKPSISRKPFCIVELAFSDELLLASKSWKHTVPKEKDFAGNNPLYKMKGTLQPALVPGGGSSVSDDFRGGDDRGRNAP